MTLLTLLGQQTFDPISGGSGWVGAGLLGCILAWLFFKHLPAKDTQMKELIESHRLQVEKKDSQIDGQRKEFTVALNEMGQTFKGEVHAERMASETHFKTLAESMNNAFRTLGEQLRTHSERNQQWIELLKREVENKKQELANKEAQDLREHGAGK